MKKYFVLTLSTLLSFIFYSNAFAVMACPDPIEIQQPDGTKIKVVVRGDEFCSWYEDLDGYTVIKDSQTKFWTYAQKDDFGDLVSSKNFVGKISPKDLNIQRVLKDDNKIFKAEQNRNQFDTQLQKASYNTKNLNNSLQKVQYSSLATGTKTNFVLLVQFKDLSFNQCSPFINKTDEEIINGFDELFNKTNYTKDGAVGSVKDYFKEVSYGKMTYNSVISPIITIDKSYKYYGWNNGETVAWSRVREMVRQALEKLHNDYPSYNFKNIWPNTDIPEGFTVIHAGPGAESAGANSDYIWSHKSSISPITLDNIEFSSYHIEPSSRGSSTSSGLIRIGVICHESIHFFDIPDLYDTTYLSAGLGQFCIMAGGEWNGGSGNRPAHPCAWVKNKLGWIKCQTAVDGINSIGESATDDEAFYKFVPSNFDVKEYFLMENRQSVGFDKSLPGTKRGLLIYHIDERKKNNSNYAHYLVDIEEADGTSNWINDHLARSSAENGRDSDYFRNGTVSFFSDDCISSPNSKSYTYQSSGIKISEISASSSLMSFIYGKDITIIDDLSSVVCYPNPARNGYINITNLPTDVENFSIEIFTITSKLVKSYSVDDTEFTTDGFRKARWDCKNDSGEDVAPGVYLILIKNSSKKKIFKVAVIR